MTLLNTPLGYFETYPTGTITRALTEGQWWDDHLKPCLDEASGGLALDLGAHIGWFSRYLAERHDQVIACEPHPETFQLLEKNTGFYVPMLARRIQRWPVAAYRETCTLLQADSTEPGADMGAVSFSEGAVPRGGYVVPAVVLDDYLPRHQDARVTLIKSDCQGADLCALQGLERTIAHARPLIVFEWEEGLAQQHAHTWEDYLRFFHHLSYSVERITTDYWDFVARPR